MRKSNAGWGVEPVTLTLQICWGTQMSHFLLSSRVAKEMYKHEQKQMNKIKTLPEQLSLNVNVAT